MYEYILFIPDYATGDEAYKTGVMKTVIFFHEKLKKVCRYKNSFYICCRFQIVRCVFFIISDKRKEK